MSWRVRAVVKGNAGPCKLFRHLSACLVHCSSNVAILLVKGIVV